MNRESLDEWLKRSQLGITLAVLAFMVMAWGGVRASEFIFAQWGILLVALLWLVRLWVQSPYRFWLPPATWAVAPFVAYAGWRYATADVEYIARQEFLQIALFALFLLAVVNSLHGQNMLRALAIGIVAIATLVSMYGCYQWLTQSGSVVGMEKPLGYYGRASGTYINPNHFAGLLEMALPVAIATAFSGRLKILPRIFLGYAAVVIVAGIAVSGSRGGWICAGVSLLVLMLVLATRRGYRITTLAVAAAVFIGGYWLYGRTVQNRVQATYLTGHEREHRFWIWEAGLKVWQIDPWFGVGPDHFDQRYRLYRQPVDKTQARPGRAHNDYLNTLADYGVIGLALLLLAIATAATSAIRGWRYLKRSTDELKGRESNRSAMVLGSGCGLIAILLHSIFDFNMHVPANALIAVTLLAIVISHLRFATSRWWLTARWPVLLGASVMLTAALAMLGSQAASRSRAVIAEKAAARAKEGSAEQIAALKRAAAAEPKNPEGWFTLGEHLRALAFVGETGNAQQAREAIDAFARAMALNKWDPMACIRRGMCLDWLERFDEALPLFKKAVELDPNYYYTRFMLGWHYYQAGDLAQAQHWTEESLRLNWTRNEALLYRSIISRAMADQQRQATSNRKQ